MVGRNVLERDGLAEPLEVFGHFGAGLPVGTVEDGDVTDP